MATGLILICFSLGGCQSEQPTRYFYLKHPDQLTQALLACHNNRVTNAYDCDLVLATAKWLRQQMRDLTHGQSYYGVSIMKAQARLSRLTRKISQQKRQPGDKGNIKRLVAEKTKVQQLVAEKQAVVRFMFIAGSQ